MREQDKSALIVSGSMTGCIALSRILLRYNVQSEFAYSAKDAFDYLKEHDSNIIFMDHSMPDMDGLQAIKTLKDNPDTADIPMVMIASPGDDINIRQTRSLEAVAVISRDLEISSVESTLLKVGLIEARPKSNQSKVDNPQLEDNPSIDDRLRSCLDSAMEEFVLPSLSHRMDAATDDLRAENEQLGKRLAGESIRLQNQIADKNEESLRAHGDLLFASLDSSEQKSRKLGWTLLVMMILAVGLLVYHNLQLKKQVDDSSGYRQQLTEIQQQLKILERREPTQITVLPPSIQSVDTRPTIEPQPDTREPLRQVTNLQGERVGLLLGISDDGSKLNVISNTGFIFQIDRSGLLVDFKPDLFFDGQDCLGQIYVANVPGIVTRDLENQLWYTPNEEQQAQLRPASWSKPGGECAPYTGEIQTLHPLLPNEPSVTGVEELQFSYVRESQRGAN